MTATFELTPNCEPNQPKSFTITEDDNGFRSTVATVVLDGGRVHIDSDRLHPISWPLRSFDRVAFRDVFALLLMMLIRNYDERAGDISTIRDEIAWLVDVQ